ncbi:uncharacterized protein LOC133196037 [Saccostrea echinata]|uniref:uncharacterized protein LOC133196037 n=1 Tax=Saccostrea echinata TaxID=191078 RepID=UPI002A83A214|nr:uncharacterized protein LOC133196037 [Saccostrea echinata]
MKMYLFLYVLIGITIGNVKGQMCSDCVHLDYTVKGLRTISRTLLDSLLLDTFNPDCLHDNQKLHIKCPRNDSAGLVVKCKKTHVIVQARGIQRVEAGAEVNLVAVERRCALVDASQENNCVNHMEDNTVSSYISKTLAHLTDTWTTVNYTGANCFSDTHHDVTTEAPVETKKHTAQYADFTTVTNVKEPISADVLREKINTVNSTRSVSMENVQILNTTGNFEESTQIANVTLAFSANDSMVLSTNSSSDIDLGRKQELNKNVRKFINYIRSYNRAPAKKCSELILVMSLLAIYLIDNFLRAATI